MRFVYASLFIVMSAFYSHAEELTAGQKTGLGKQFEEAKKLAANPKVVAAVKASNANPEGKEMTQEKWAAAAVLDPAIRSFQKNDAAEEIKKWKGEAVSEAFINNAAGTKVAFLNKTTNWSHKGKPKHEDPMAGKDWTGKVEVDESTGTQQIQIAVPVMDGGKAIGSLVVGLAVSKLK